MQQQGGSGIGGALSSAPPLSITNPLSSTLLSLANETVTGVVPASIFQDAQAVQSVLAMSVYEVRECTLLGPSLNK